jgi:hypothetical protein
MCQPQKKIPASEEAGYSNRCPRCGGEATGSARKVAENMTNSVILSEAKNLSSI